MYTFRKSRINGECNRITTMVYVGNCVTIPNTQKIPEKKNLANYMASIEEAFPAFIETWSDKYIIELIEDAEKFGKVPKDFSTIKLESSDDENSILWGTEKIQELRMCISKDCIFSVKIKTQAKDKLEIFANEIVFKRFNTLNFSEEFFVSIKKIQDTLSKLQSIVEK